MAAGKVAGGVLARSGGVVSSGGRRLTHLETAEGVRGPHFFWSYVIPMGGAMSTKGHAFTWREGKDKPGADDALKAKYKAADRTCLMCGVTFRSEWAGNRRCGSCRDWYMGAARNGDGTAYVSPFEPKDVSTELPDDYMLR